MRCTPFSRLPPRHSWVYHGRYHHGPFGIKIILRERPAVHRPGTEEFAGGVNGASLVPTERSLTMPESLVPLAGSERASLPDVTDTAPLNTAERAEITVVLRRRAELPAEIIEGPTVLSSAQL